MSHGKCSCGVGLLDGFSHFLEEVGILSLIEEIEVPAIQRVLIPVVQFVLLYMLGVLFGIASMNALPASLFSNVAAMKVVGFNAHQIANGFTQRGDALRKDKPEQAPLSPQCLAQNICEIPLLALEKFLNGTIHCVAAFGTFAAEVTAAIDGTPLVTTENYEGCGCLKVERRARQKAGGWVTVRAGKEEKYRRVPLNTDARKALAECLEVRPDGEDSHLFLGQKGNRLTSSGI